MKVLLGAASVLNANLTLFTKPFSNSATALHNPRTVTSDFLTPSIDEYIGLMEHKDLLECELLLECEDLLGCEDECEDVSNPPALPLVKSTPAITISHDDFEDQVRKSLEKSAFSKVNNLHKGSFMNFLLGTVDALATSLRGMRGLLQNSFVKSKQKVDLCACDTAQALSVAHWPELPSIIPMVTSKQDSELQERKSLEKHAHRHTAYELFKKNKSKDKHVQQPARPNISHCSLKQPGR